MDDRTIIALLVVSTGSWFFCVRSKLKWVHLLGLSQLLSLIVAVVSVELRNSGHFNAHVINGYVVLEYFIVGGALVSITYFKKVVDLVFFVGGMLVLALIERDFSSGAFFTWPSTSAIIVAGLFLAIMAMIGLFRLANTSNEPLIKQPIFWFYNIVLIYYVCQAPIFGLMSRFDQPTSSAIYDLHDYLFCFHEVSIPFLFLFTAYQTRRLKHGV